MNVVWGLILILFTLILCWLGQVISAVSPTTAAKLGLTEAESEVDPTYFVDGRGEAIWDALSLWVLPVAAVLLLIDHPSWAYFGLVGGGMYLYFAGRLLIVRRLMQQHNIRIGKPDMMKLYNGVLFLWGLIAVITIIMAVSDLPLQN